MKVGIDASRAFMRERTGTEEYAYQLIKNLTKTNDLFCQFFLYLKKGEEVDFELPKNFHIRTISREKHWTQLGLSFELLKHPVDVLFVPSHSIPLIHPKRTVVTIHGTEYRNCPKCYPLRDRLQLELNTMLSIRWARRIITPSASTKKDVIKFYKAAPEKITVVHHGAESQKSIKLKVQSDVFNILFIGRLERRKNIVNLIKAFNIVKERTEQVKRPLKLILAGKPGFGFDEIRKEAGKSEWKNDMILTGYVSDKEKEDLYKKANMFVMPSLAEGFGLPILEAMQKNIPVLCSDISPFFEISMDSVLYFDPRDPQDIADKINIVMVNVHLQKDLIAKGGRNIENYSWEKCAAETLKVLIG
ncbi:MAG: glycosyltransferase family 1 protein [Candidatus Paceibacterota bacterium]|jgi:glycosyltransferase involved in cell wall biosynthesis